MKEQRMKRTVVSLAFGLSILVGSEFTDSIGMKFVEIPDGKFMMGIQTDTGDCPKDDPFTAKREDMGCLDKANTVMKKNNAVPYHEESVKGFGMSETEVTQMQYYQVMGSNPSWFQSDRLGTDSRNHPVENLTIKEVYAFIKKLNELDKTAKYRLPTEIEWEYAAKGGTDTQWSFGNNDHAWNKANSMRTPHRVKEKQPNPFGLYDMYGNVCEWTSSGHIWGSKDKRIGRWVIRGESFATLIPDLYPSSSRSSLNEYQRGDNGTVGIRVVRSR